jgi:hypothetical protein
MSDLIIKKNEIGVDVLKTALLVTIMANYKRKKGAI